MTRSQFDAWRWLAAVLLAWAGVFALRAVAVGGTWPAMPLTTWLVLLLWILAFAVGYSLLNLMHPPQRSGMARLPPRAWFALWIYVLSFAAIVGAVLISYEFAIVRGYGFSTPVALIRMAEVAGAEGPGGGSWISGIGRLLTPALQVGWILALFCPTRLLRRTWLALIVATLAVFIEQTLFEGGRFFSTGLIIAAMATWLMRRGTRVPQVVVKKARPQRRRWTLMILVGVAAILVFGKVFIDRVEALNINFSMAYSMFTTSFTIDASGDTLQRLEGANSAPRFALYMFWMYITQGPNEFDLLLSHEPLEHAYGLVQFAQIGQGLSKLTGLEIGYDQFAQMPNPGTYTTIVGPNYMDFGVVGSWIVAFILGFLTASTTRRFTHGVMWRMGLAAPLFVAVGLFSPIVSLLVNLWPAMVWAWVVGATAHRYHARVAAADVPARLPDASLAQGMSS